MWMQGDHVWYDNTSGGEFDLMVGATVKAADAGQTQLVLATVCVLAGGLRLLCGALHGRRYICSMEALHSWWLFRVGGD